MDVRTTPCPKCGHPTCGDTAWRKLPKPRAARQRRNGMCSRCARREGNPSPATVPGAEAVSEWNWLHSVGELSELDSMAKRIRLAAPRIGMTVGALEKALQRAGIRNPVTNESTQHLRRPGLHSECLECRKVIHHVDNSAAEVRVAAARLAGDPDSMRRRRELDAARERLADHEAWRDLHLDLDHAEGVAA